ncbi:MAG: phosphotransferase [Planctomycetales bacterium]|nr:phosphotransferase [Planctomycetales bacterium]
MLQHVLRHYRAILGSTPTIETLGGAGGFSGAQLWRLSSSAGTWCLRRWPEGHPDEQRLRQIHQFLAAAHRAELPVPLPQLAEDGRTYVRQHAAWWELTPWLPGEADYLQEPCDDKLVAAIRTLARLHLAVAPLSSPIAPTGNPTLPTWAPIPAKLSSQPHEPGIAPQKPQKPQMSPQLGPQLGPSPALRERWAMLGQTPQRVGELQQAAGRLWPALRDSAAVIFRRAPSAAKWVLQQHRDAPRLLTPQQWVVRDIWHDHVLFENDEVSGLVDFGAIRVDSVATDIARLLGSMEPVFGLSSPDPSGPLPDLDIASARWQQGLAAYQDVRPLSPAELELVQALDRASAVLTGFSWLGWIAVEQRSFPGREQEITRRLAQIALRLRMVEQG